MGFKAIDGPAKGIYYSIRRAPRYLRFVVDRVSGKKDVLDQLDDEPSQNEVVSVYIQESFEGMTHVDFDTEAGKFADYANATYTHITGVDGQKLRDTAAWREWVDRRAVSDNRRTRARPLYPDSHAYKAHNGSLLRKLAPPSKRTSPNY